MVNEIGGKNYKKGKRRDRNKVGEFDENSGNMFYAQIIKILGDNRAQVKRHDSQICQAIIPGRMKKHVWFKPGDFAVIKEDEICWKVVDAPEIAKACQLFNITAIDEGYTGIIFGNDAEEDKNEKDEAIKKLCQQSFKNNEDKDFENKDENDENEYVEIEDI